MPNSQKMNQRRTNSRLEVERIRLILAAIPWEFPRNPIFWIGIIFSSVTDRPSRLGIQSVNIEGHNIINQHKQLWTRTPGVSQILSWKHGFTLDYYWWVPRVIHFSWVSIPSNYPIIILPIIIIIKSSNLGVPSGNLTVCYWTWPSRNSGFIHWTWWFSH